MRVAGPVVAFAAVLLLVVGGVYAVGVQLDERPSSDPLTVEYTVTNVGNQAAPTVTDQTATTTVTLAVNGTDRATDTQADVSAGERATGTLSAPDVATAFKPGERVPVTVSTDNGDSISKSVLVSEREAADPQPVDGFAVSIADTTSPVNTSETVTVTAVVENTATISDTQTVTLDGAGLGTNSTTVSLNASETAAVPLSLTAATRGVYTATVRSDDDTASAALIVVDQSSGPAAALVTVDSPDRLVAGSDTARTVERVAGTVPTVLVPLVLLVGGIGVVGFVISALGPLRGRQRGGR